MQNQVVIITGAAKGIGRQIALSFARNGARLALADIEPLDKTEAEARALGAEVLTKKTDVREENDVRALMEQVVARFGQIDVLINNAAIVSHPAWTPTWPKVRDMDKNFWDRVIDTNLTGYFVCIKHAVPSMETRRSGHIICVAPGLHGGKPNNLGRIGQCAYGVSKTAASALAYFVAEEERDFNICVVTMNPRAGAPIEGPGGIATEEAPPDVRARLPGPEIVKDNYVLAAQAGMEFSGHNLLVKDGRLEIES